MKPLLEAVRANCQKVEQEVNNSTDEQIIPAKMKKSGGVRQYGLPVLGAEESGIMHTFFFYEGKNSTSGNSCSAESIILKLEREIICFSTIGF